MRELPWITNFLVTSEAICQQMNIIGKSHHGCPKNHYSRWKTMYYFISDTLCYVLNTIIDFADVTEDNLFKLSIVTSPLSICDVTRTWGTGVETPHSSIVLARANGGKGDLHWWITTVNIDFTPLGIHGLACKKAYNYITYRYNINMSTSIQRNFIICIYQNKCGLSSIG